MDLSIHTNSFALDIYGFSGIAANSDYAGTAFKLSGKMWQIVKSTGLKNKGKNIWVYEKNKEVFAGLELEELPGSDSTLEYKNIILTKYAYFKHTGPYKLLPSAGQNLYAELKAQGFETGYPYIEIYGHWTADETQLETELLVALK